MTDDPLLFEPDDAVRPMWELLAECTRDGDAHGPDGPDVVDAGFFRVRILPDAAEARRADFAALLDRPPLAGLNARLENLEEVSYVELGADLGDQRAALVFMALGAYLGLWKLLTPRAVLGDTLTRDEALMLAQAGYVTIARLTVTPPRGRP